MEGVLNCYVFKSQLQEYAQKVGLPTPVYETTKEGPSHEPSFRSTVIVNDVRYDSLPGFLNRKAAEQSAAEVALLELAKHRADNRSITQPVHETGLCKNLLQEYAQKMNYAMPIYQCKKDEAPGRASVFSCTVDIGGILYIGGAAKTKKEAEIKAARTALLAIQSSASHSSGGDQQLTVIPCRKRPAESIAPAEETSTKLKPKKARFTKKSSKRKSPKDKIGHAKDETVIIGANINPSVEALASGNDVSGDQEMKSEPITSEAMKHSENGISVSSSEDKTGHIKDENVIIGANISPLVEALASGIDVSDDQEMKSEPITSEAMKNSENEISVSSSEDKMGHIKDENVIIGASIGPLVEALASANDESGDQEMKSEPITLEAMKNSENGISVSSSEDKTGHIKDENEIIRANINPLVEALANANDESGDREMKSEPITSEAMKNSEENGISICYCKQETVAGEGSLALNGPGVSENENSTKLHYMKTVDGEVLSTVFNGDVPEMNVEENKQQ